MEVILISTDGKYRTVRVELKRYGLTVEEAESKLNEYMKKNGGRWVLRTMERIAKYEITEIHKL